MAKFSIKVNKTQINNQIMHQKGDQVNKPNSSEENKWSNIDIFMIKKYGRIADTNLPDTGNSL